ncbi:VOC family protein [Cyanobium sp. HWJ4-Hawea]|uniref:VOC family protein n=1 Tax=unclassified Cyanobium TaxID=2627006 RepID=UPI0020CF3F8A|nr:MULTISPECIES: VOC family protein [unclassified Cyanobium]MCP9774852.1 VOC family protein [Cyanobium sp. WAJ14-Wanaka]MCP9809448.1 VOC family protein [Cyanobium sp. HWJ4-Hawea]
MTLDHISFGTQDIAATQAFYEGQLGLPVMIHERMLMQEGGTVEHVFFDCGGDCALAFMQWQQVPGVPSDYDTGINRGLGVPNGTFHFAFRCASLVGLEERRLALIAAGVVVGAVLDLDPYRSFFLEDPVNRLRLEYTTRVRQPLASDRDPEQRQFPASLALFEQAAKPG